MKKTSLPEDDFPRTHTLKVKKPLVLDYLVRTTAGTLPSAKVEQPSEDQAAASDLLRLVASVCGAPVAALGPDRNLGVDLNLDSLGRVELLSAIEQELGVYVEETQVGPETTLAQLATLVQAGAKAAPASMPGWGRSIWCRVLRAFLQYVVIFPLARLFYTTTVRGREHLTGLEGPVLFVANHNMRLDNPLIYMALPFRWLWRLCTAAAADDIFGNPVGRIGAPLLGNAFPFAREGAVRTSLEHLGQLLDGGWSVLIYPEGFRSSGEIKPFKAGTGLIAVESRTPVAPLRVILRKGGVFDGAALLSRGEVEIRFGKPMTFARQSHYVEATARLEAAVRGCECSERQVAPKRADPGPFL